MPQCSIFSLHKESSGQAQANNQARGSGFCRNLFFRGTVETFVLFRLYEFFPWFYKILFGSSGFW
uniref:Uncharacterized protein n=1 Tax=Oryza brachyantha TaxID=4533 RepID=J3MX29_ORYBR